MTQSAAIMLESRLSMAIVGGFASSKMPPAVPSDAARGRVTTGVEDRIRALRGT
jgi:hypothetical protein